MGQSIGVSGSGNKMPGQWRLIDVANLIMAVMVYKQSTYFVEAAKRNSPCYPEGTLAPNDADCSSYLHCSYERFLLMPCPGGLNFDPKTLTCNFPDRIARRGNCQVLIKPEAKPQPDYIDYGNGYEYEYKNDIAEYEDDTVDDNVDDTYYDKDDTNDEEYEYYDDEDYDDEYEYYSDEDYEEYENEVFIDYQEHKKEERKSYGLDGSSCSPEGSLAPNPNDCSSFLMCNHKKYMVRPCHDGLVWDTKYNTCNRAQNVIQKVQCKVLQHQGSVVIEKLSMKPKKAKKSKQRQLLPAKPIPQQAKKKTDGPNIDFKFFPRLS